MKRKDVLTFLSKYYSNVGDYSTDWIRAEVIIENQLKSQLFVQSHNDFTYLTSVKGYSETDAVNNILSEVDTIIKKQDIYSYCKIRVQKIRIFDCLLFIPHQYHYWFKGFDDEIYKSLIYFIPVNHCEFGGAEGAEFPVLTRSMLDPSEWNREITPMVSIRLNKPSSGIKFKPVFRYDKEQNVYRWLKDFKNNDDWMQTKNYNGEMVSIDYETKEDENYIIRDNDTILFSGNYESVKEYLKLFFTK